MHKHVARRMWEALEPIHVVVYFAPEAMTSYAEIGLKGYWMGYFASRAAPMGPVPAEVVAATFYNFNMDRVRKAIPDAWSLASPADVLLVRNDIASAATGRLIKGSPDDIASAATLAQSAALAAAPEGRALFAGHASLPWPEEPKLKLWHAATLLREHRGDGHIAVLMSEGIDGFEAHLLAAAAKRIDPAFQQKARGISEEEWILAADRLRSRGILGTEGQFTDEGQALKDHIETRTDQLAEAPYLALGEANCELLESLCRALVGGDSPMPFPNPVGLTRSK